MYCNSCGNETPDQGMFCLHCGTRLNKECPRCAEIIKFKAKICRFCGYEFAAEEIAEIERVEQEKVLRQEAERKKKREGERGRVEREKELEKERREEAEYHRWHRPEIVGTWGGVVFQCTQCSTLNSLNLESCRRCSASLKSAPKVRNPFS